MHIADMTMFYAPASGGVRTYLEAKHRRLQLYSGVRHSILVPGGDYSHNDGLYCVPAPILPFGKGYRFPIRRAPWRNLLRSLRPDLIEVGDLHDGLGRAGRRAPAERAGDRLLPFRPAAAGQQSYRQLVGHQSQWLRVAPVWQFRSRAGAQRGDGDKLIHLGVKNVRAAVGRRPDTFCPQRRDPEVRRELGPADDTRLMIFAGRGSREKNLHILLETARQLGKPYHLLLVGSSMPQRVPDNVTVIDRFCPASEVARFMASSDVLLHAGNQETFGPVALEAMACGIPVVAARAGALPELVPFYSGRLCRPLDARAMAHTVRELFEDDPRLLGQQARQHVEAHHAWDAVVAGLLAHYHAVLGTAELPVAVHG